MGIKGLNQIIKKYTEDVFIQRHLSEYAYKKIAVDISLYLFKYKAIFGSRWLTAFINLISVLRKNDIHCIFIFDGKAPKEKDEERQSRADSREKLESKVYDIEYDIDQYDLTGTISPLIQKVWDENQSNDNMKRLLGPANIKNNFNIKIVREYLEKIKGQVIKITEDDFNMARKLFDILQVPYIKADGEAESFASQLCVRGIVDAVASEDTDVLAYGTPIFLTKINTSDETCIEIKHQDLCEKMGLTPYQFTDLCIMCGTDYNSNIKGIGPDKSYKLLVDNGSIEEIEKLVDKDGINKFETKCLKYTRVRELFSVPEKIELKIAYCGKPDLVLLRKWLWHNNISFNVDMIVSSFKTRHMEFED
jgi:5'-3' exonuclease